MSIQLKSINTYQFDDIKMQCLLEILLFSMIVGLINVQGHKISKSNLDQYDGNSLSHNAIEELLSRLMSSPFKQSLMKDVI